MLSSQDYDQEDLEILSILNNYSKEKLEQAQGIDKPTDQKTRVEAPVDDNLFLSDTVLVMLAKEIQYVETLTRFKSGFLFNDRKLNIFAETVTPDLVPPQYEELWNLIQNGSSKRCRNLKKLFTKMLSSKNVMFAKQCFLIYFQCLQRIMLQDQQTGGAAVSEEALKEASKAFSHELYGHIVTEDEHENFVNVKESYSNITLLNKNFHLKELFQFQHTFRHHYHSFKNQLHHFIEVIYYCLAVEYYCTEKNYLYEGYYKNTELDTFRGNPKFKIQ